MPLTTTVVAAPVTHSARPPSMRGSLRYGEQQEMYMAAGGYAAGAAYSQSSAAGAGAGAGAGANGSARLVVLTNVDGPAVQRSGSYAYSYKAAAPPPPPPAPASTVRFYASNQAAAQNGMKFERAFLFFNALSFFIFKSNRNFHGINIFHCELIFCSLRTPW